MPWMICEQANCKRLAGMVMFGLLSLTTFVTAADKYELSESEESGPHKVQIQLELDGQLQTSAGDGKAIALKLTGGGELAYSEVRIPGTGRDVKQYRGLRVYSSPSLKIQVAENVTQPVLRDEVRLILAEGQTDGVRVTSPKGPLTYSEMELLRAPLDSLSVLALLPADEVEVGEKWTAPGWVLPFLVGVEAVEKESLTCKLEKVTDKQAQISFQGEIKGGILGAASEIKVEGELQFDLEKQRLTRATVTQTETRSVGVVNPGLKVTAKVTLTREPAARPTLITDELVEQIKTAEDPAPVALLLDAPDWGATVKFERRWHLFHQNPSVAVLRFVDRGSLLAQCNISPIAPAKAGEHTSEKQFQADVQQAVGPEFRKIDTAEIVPPKQDGLYLYRVVASGETRQPIGKEGKEFQIVPVQWMYYLVTHPDGRQMVLVFTIEKELLEKFGDQDFLLAWGVEFQALKPRAEVKTAPSKPAAK